MRVITEERLNEIAQSYEGHQYEYVLRKVIEECQEIDQLTVSKLRPMSDAPDGDEWVIVFEDDLKPTVVQRSGDKYIKSLKDGFIDDWCQPGDFVGWLPFPIYKPEQL